MSMLFRHSRHPPAQ